MKVSVESLEEEIYDRRREVRYDIRDMTVEAIVNKFIEELPDELDSIDKYNCIYIPDYQRDFTWDEERQSKFIESLMMGLPIPLIFVAENSNSSWEIVDGSQRIRTLYAFVKRNLKLKKLKTIRGLNEYRFEELEQGRKGKFLNTALRIIVLSEETTDDVKKEMFERINRGSDLLKPMERRKGSCPGIFTDLIYDYCDRSKKLAELAPVDKWLSNRQEREELLLRFFALSDTKAYNKGIPEGISQFLDKYLNKKNEELKKMERTFCDKKLADYKKRASEVLNYVEANFPYGYRHAPNPQTKRAVFEAISVGVYLAISEGKQKQGMDKNYVKKVLESNEFRQYTHIAYELHKKKKLFGRIDMIYRTVKGEQVI